MTKKEGKPKMLCYGDSAISSTGFGQVFRNILSRLVDDFDITQIAINHVNTRDKFGREVGHNMPFEILDARYLSQEDIQAGKKPDMFGKYKLAQYILSNEFDIFFTIQDPLVVKDVIAFFHRDKVVAQRKKFGFKEPKTVYYFPVDSDFFPKEWMNIINKFDVAVPYTQYATDICKKADPKSKLHPYILHGIDNKLFYRLPEKRRNEIRESYGIKKDEWIIHSSNRNQPRKDPPRNLQILKEFKKLVPNSKLVMHCDPEENFYNLRYSLKYFDLKEGKDVIFTGGKIGQQVLTVEKMNEIYNLADVGLSTTVGEGFGLCLDFKTNIYTEENIKEIKDINLSDKVLSSDGKFHKVLGVKRREYNGNLFKIATWKHNIPVQCSDNHPFMVYKKGWVLAKDLKINDILCLPLIQTEKDNSFDLYNYLLPKLDEYRKKIVKDRGETFAMESNFTVFKQKEIDIPKKILLNTDLSYFLGVYIAEGSANVRKGTISISLNNKEQEIIDKIKETIKKTFGITKFDYANKKRMASGYQGKTLIFYSSILANFLVTTFGKEAREKKIPSFLIKKADLSALLRGIFHGDGWSDNRGQEYSISTTSKHIAYFTKLICMNLGIVVSISKSRTEYKIRCSGNTRHIFHNIVKNTECKFRYFPNQNRCRIEENLLLSPIKAIEIEKVENYPLADIEIEDTHDFVAENCIVHNSTLEYFATQAPMILPDNTTARELIGKKEERGYLLKSGFDPSHWTIWPFCPKEPPRPLVDVNHAVELLYKVYKKRPTKKIEAAYKFATENSWDIIAEQWRELFKNIIKED